VKRKPERQNPTDDDKEARNIQALAQSDTEPFDVPTTGKIGSTPLGDINESSGDLKKELDDLKGRIADARRRHDIPLDSALGQPDWEERAADGHLDLPDHDGE
jgi:hypothetical protein